MEKINHFSKLHVPEEYKCPITGQIMVDPVITETGHAYEKEVISNWLEKHNTDPNTNIEIYDKRLVPNIPLRSQIRNFVQDNQKVFEQGLIDAAKIHDYETTQLILKLGIKVNTADWNGWTALDHVILKKDLKIIELLVHYSASIDLCTASITDSEAFFKHILHTHEAKLQPEAKQLHNKLLTISSQIDLMLAEPNSIAPPYPYGSDRRRNEIEEVYYRMDKSFGSTNKEIHLLRLEVKSLEFYIKSLDTNNFTSTGASTLNINDLEKYLNNLDKKINEIHQQYSNNLTQAKQNFLKTYSVEYYKYSCTLEDTKNKEGKNEKAKIENLIKALKYFEEKIKPLATELISLKQNYHNLLNNSEIKLLELEIKKSVKCSALLLTIKEGKIDIFNFLIKEVFKGNYRLLEQLMDTHGWTALHWAVSSNQIEICRILLENNFNVNARDKFGNNALHLAAYYGHNELITLLLEYEINYKEVNSLAQTPIDLAVSNQNLKQATLIKSESKAIKQSKYESLVDTVAKQTEQIHQLQLQLKEVNLHSSVNINNQSTDSTPTFLYLKKELRQELLYQDGEIKQLQDQVTELKTQNEILKNLVGEYATQLKSIINIIPNSLSINNNHSTSNQQNLSTFNNLTFIGQLSQQPSILGTQLVNLNDKQETPTPTI